MAKYRKKPMVIEAFRWMGYAKWSKEDSPQWFLDASDADVVYFEDFGNVANSQLRIRTRKGGMHVSVGDYIIRRDNGGLYPCRGDIFEATYEPVEEEIIGGYHREDGSGGVWKRHVE